MTEWQDRMWTIRSLSGPNLGPPEGREEETGEHFAPFPVTPWYFGHLGLSLRFTTGRTWSLKIEVADRENAIIVMVELPFVSIDDISLVVQGETVTVEGVRRRRWEMQGDRYYHSELQYGR